MATFTERIKRAENPVARELFSLMERKTTNLAVAIDVTHAEDLLRWADLLGPCICLLKTHIDILKDFTQECIEQLLQLAKRHDFLILEDRKFADIGNTVKDQYLGGMYQIAKWANLITVHSIPGPGILMGLNDASQGLDRPRGALLLAEMSSEGNLITEIYTEKSIQMAGMYRQFVTGFICQKRRDLGKNEEEDGFIYMTPGVSMSQKGDSLGQKYNDPETVILDRWCDVLIVGRGILGTDDPLESAREYRKIGWDAYRRRCFPKDLSS